MAHHLGMQSTWCCLEWWSCPHPPHFPPALSNPSSITAPQRDYSCQNYQCPSLWQYLLSHLLDLSAAFNVADLRVYMWVCVCVCLHSLSRFYQKLLLSLLGQFILLCSTSKYWPTSELHHGSASLSIYTLSRLISFEYHQCANDSLISIFHLNLFIDPQNIHIYLTA